MYLTVCSSHPLTPPLCVAGLLPGGSGSTMSGQRNRGDGCICGRVGRGPKKSPTAAWAGGDSPTELPER